MASLKDCCENRNEEIEKSIETGRLVLINEGVYRGLIGEIIASHFLVNSEKVRYIVKVDNHLVFYLSDEVHILDPYVEDECCEECCEGCCEEPRVPQNQVEQTKVKNFIYHGFRRKFTVVEDGIPQENSFYVKEQKERIIHSGNRTICILDDGSKGISKCCPEDDYNETRGIKIAYLRAKIKSLQKELNGLTK